ncbi:MAG: phenylalanine--tRNA ligase subunit beta [Clostridia bacterium]|nr:phenylalanine--tRNA ligase subunit beta [Clostridia bacterium]
MKAPVEWMLSYTDIKAETKEEIHELASQMTLSGSKVESVDNVGADVTDVVIGYVTEVRPHENSDHLQICKVDVGGGNVLQIVTGAPNVRLGGYIPTALDGANIAGGHTIKTGKLRGVESQGMMCSFDELGLDAADYPGGIKDGLIILQDLDEFKGYTAAQFDALKGQDVMKVLGAGGTVIDFEITSNRADCFSILGLAREAAVTENRLTGRGASFNCPEPKVKEEAKERVTDLVSVKVDAPDLCPRYMARAVTNVKIGPSPKWMRKRLSEAGVRPINNIVDITNYVMLEYGQPMHAFDIRTIRGREITVRRAFDGEKLTTLDEVERTLDSSMLVIADKEGGIAVAGVMGGLNSEIRDDTPTVVYEAAIFDGVTVRRGAKKIGLRTESSSRFEKGLDPVTCAKALDRAAELTELLGAGTVCKGVIDCYSVKKQPRRVKCGVNEINRFIGIHATREEMEGILTDLECEPHFDEGYVIPPSFRDDLQQDADIAEEVARFYGYNRIESSLLSGCESMSGGLTREQKLSDRVRRTLSGLGYNEMLTFSFGSPAVFDKLRLEADDKLRDAVVISNPLGEDFSVMRTTMVPSALEALAVNHAHRVEKASLFEISYIYIKTEAYPDKLPEHRRLITMAGYGNSNFFDFKGDVEALLKALRVQGYGFEPDDGASMPYMHPGRLCRLTVGNNLDGGFFGQIHPVVAAAFEVPENTMIACLNVNTLFEMALDIPQNKELPKYPAVTRDIAVVLDKSVPQGHVQKLVCERGGKILESCKLFDCYEGLQVGPGKKSLAYALSFRAPDRTLTDEDVDKAMKKILNGLETVFGGTLRE